MAEATLNDVVARLRADNERQLKEQGNTTDAINTLSGMMRGLLDYLEIEALRQKERDAEAKKRTASVPSPSSSSSSGGGGLGLYIPPVLAGLATTLSSIGAFAASLAAATEGLGPSLSDINKFVTSIRTVFFAPIRALSELSKTAFGGLTFSQYISAQVTRLTDFFKRFEFDTKSARFRDLTTGRYAKPDALYRTIQPIFKLLDNLGEAIKSIRIPDPVMKSFNAFTDMFKEGGRFAGISTALANNRFVATFIKVLRPIAAILSVFDGLENSQKEMEDREGFFNKYLGGGIGGFVSGTVGSFFGELFNLFLDAPMWIIKKMLPEYMLNTSQDGKVSINRDASTFAKVLAGVDEFNFNTLITDLVQVPFDQLGLAFDFLSGILTGDENTKEKMDAYFAEKGLFGTALDVGSWAINLVMSPVNSIFREVERAFSADGVADDQTFTQRIGSWVTSLGDTIMSTIPTQEELKEAFPKATDMLMSLGNWANDLYEAIMSIIPSWEEIKSTIADVLPDNKLGNFARRNLFNVESSTPAVDQLGSSISNLGEMVENISRFESGIESLGGYDQNATAQLRQLISDEQRSLEDARAEIQALLAQASQNPAANQQVVQNYQQQFETIMLPNSGALDDGDSIRR